MDIYSFLQIAGGIGLFLYGMKVLGNALEKLAGAGLESTLAKLTNNRIKGLMLGIFVTAAIQSSSATNIMLVGFVNAGIMKFVQAIPVVLGASIGTTVTGQILRLGDIGDSGSAILKLLKPSSFAPLLICIGAFMVLISKKKKVKDIAALLLGFGMLFYGMTVMEEAFKPLEESAEFQSLFTLVSNPFLGILLGIIVCMILQSASASVGILQAIASAGGVNFAMAAPILIGINIGKAFPVIIASLAGKKDAKRTAWVGLVSCFIAGILAIIVIYGVVVPFKLIAPETVMGRGSIADFNTVFNLIGSLILLPFVGLLDKICCILVRDGKPSKQDESMALLDDIFLKTPAIALEQCQTVINNMGSVALENYRLAIDLIQNYDEKVFETIDENEAFLDNGETHLSSYIVKVTAKDLHPEQTAVATEILHSVMDFERIGDHCVKISEVAAFNKAEKIPFSDFAKKELNTIGSAVEMILNITTDAFFTDNPDLAAKVEPLRNVVDNLSDTIRANHVVRLQKGSCSVQSGISLVELLNSLERISAYSSNIALHILAKHSGGEFDEHAYVENLHANDESFKIMLRQYSEEFHVSKLSNISTVE